MIPGSARAVDLTPEVTHRLTHLLTNQAEIIRFADEPALASLCTCVGLAFEMGRPGFDRLSPFFGTDPNRPNPWKHQIFSEGGEFGIVFELSPPGELEVRHSDLVHVLSPASLGLEGTLRRLVIHPARVAAAYRSRGFELVVVRDWILTSSLAQREEERVGYLTTNEWEIESNIARTQASLMNARQLVFSGTHDVADHLLGADREGFDWSRDLTSQTLATLDRSPHLSRYGLEVSYLVAVALDDMAQPSWYRSIKHRALIQWGLEEIKKHEHGPGYRRPLPPSFHRAAQLLRDKNASWGDLLEELTEFESSFISMEGESFNPGKSVPGLLS